MSADPRNGNPSSGPLGMGPQGYVLIAAIMVATILFASTRHDWISMLLSALLPPLVLFTLIFALTYPRRAEDAYRGGPQRGRLDLLTFLARTNPLMFLLFGAAAGRDDERYRQLLRAGPYTAGPSGWIALAILVLLPLALTLILTAATGHLPSHNAP